MRLSERLQVIADEVAQGESVADIGTDHGLLPIYLTRTGKSPRVVLSDISAKALKKALADCEEYEPGRTFDLREGYGLEVLASGEVDTVVIAGMGGILISEILTHDIDHARSFKRFILQPRNNKAKLRFSLSRIGFTVEKEILVREGRYIPDIFVVRSGNDCMSAPCLPEEDVRWEYPDALIRDRNEYTSEYLKRELAKQLGIKRKIESGSSTSAENAGRIRIIEEKISRLKLLLCKPDRCE